ncbi:serine/threonine protein phosphatase [Flavobacterium agricola]|uniref:Serine/threonine protein phosphatase n=1 Tax=Flavobacterium agricola TaxID=2870839 RepID=A0ABY6M2E2_9FLAO|nr:metallophosphoesterase family protein [Flavobacterium agricola]UYW01058.1 serine/threonine protein phosphatase [Flavobacterium agricola]
MGRTLVIGDIHGGLKALHQVLERAKVTPQDQLIFLGDYVDGWPDTANLISFLMELNTTHSCIFLKGNHEELFLNWYYNQKQDMIWLKNGGLSTFTIYKELDEQIKEQHISFLENLAFYHIDAQNRLFVHGGFTNLRGIQNEYNEAMVYWDRTLWETALALDPKLEVSDLRYPKRFRKFTEIFIGHTTVQEIGENTPQNFANVWNVDTGAGFGNKLSILDVNTKQFWQSDDLSELYNTPGRTFVPRL